MTCVAIGESGGLDVVLPNELFAEEQLVRRRAVIHVHHLIGRAEKWFRLPMAIKAPPHVELLRLPGERHFVHLPMASRAADTFRHVDAVIEVGIIRQVMNARPLDRLAGLPRIAHRLEDRRIRPNLRVARHANLRRRNSGEGGLLDAGVAISAIDPKPADMMLMAEWHRLFEWNVNARVKI
jgi:hypothetical protein